MPFHDPLTTVILPSADNDLEDILQYTRVHHGLEQAKSYHSKLMDAIHLIAQSPDVGMNRSELSVGLQTFPIGKHIILYHAQPDMVYITPILHQKADISAHHVH